MSEQDKMARLQSARTKVDEHTRTKMRLTVEHDNHVRRVQELEQKCKDDFECEISELPGLIGHLEEEAEKAIASAEQILASSPVPTGTPRSV